MVALAACGSQPGPLTPIEYCNKYAQDVCDGVVRACLMTEASCKAGRLIECSNQAQENAGRDFIPTNADAYLNKVNAAYGKLKQGELTLGASEFQALNQARSKVYRGTVLANGVCAADADCLDPLICDKNHCGTASMVAQGEGCANTGETCPPGFYCGNSAGVPLCVTKVDLGGFCDTAPCLENLRCLGGACAVQLGIGQVCAVDQDCESGFCEPYAAKCALDVQFGNGSAACNFMSGN
jgi:hypothetical protein